jgi:hypothetical protein
MIDRSFAEIVSATTLHRRTVGSLRHRLKNFIRYTASFQFLENGRECIEGAGR